MDLRNLKLTLEYDGTDFGGWQRQPNARTVQAVVEDELARMTGAPALVRGAGRTDSGVHARAQVANFTTTTRVPADGFRRGLNAGLPRDVAITECVEVPLDFEARRSARGKHYAYRLLNRPDRSALLDRTSWHVGRALDLDAMAAAGRLLLGEHDFSAFRAAGCDARTAVRVMRRVEVLRVGELVEIHLEATAFLRNMVRVIAGTLVEVGRGRRSIASVAEALESRERAHAGKTAPPHGLTLERVFYE